MPSETKLHYFDGADAGRWVRVLSSAMYLAADTGGLISFLLVMSNMGISGVTDIEKPREVQWYEHSYTYLDLPRKLITEIIASSLSFIPRPPGTREGRPRCFRIPQCTRSR